MMRGLITAIRTLTILRVPGRDCERFQEALLFFPIVGGVIGGLAAMLAWLAAEKGHWPAGAGVVCVALTSLLTGGLHLDGLADVFDSLGGKTRERRLEIMKDPRIGSFGVAALVLFLLAKVLAVARLAEMERYVWMVLPFVVSRVVQVQLIVSLPYARAEGGTGARFVEGAKMAHWVGALIPGAVICLAVGGGIGVGILGLAIAGCLGLGMWMKRMFGGVTGDLIGMGSEVAETLIFVGLAA